MNQKNNSDKPNLYSYNDIIGLILSVWRCRAVAPCVQGKQLMDLACGDNRLVKLLGFGTGVDISPYKGVDIVHPDFTHLPFDDKSLDTVTILAALNYFDNTVEVLRDIERILKDDGVLIISFLNQRVSKIWHLIKEKDITPRVAFSVSELNDYLAEAGLFITQKKHFMLGVNCIYLIKKEINQ